MTRSLRFASLALGLLVWTAACSNGNGKNDDAGREDRADTDGPADADADADADSPAEADAEAGADADADADSPAEADAEAGADAGAGDTWVMGYYVGYQLDDYPPDVVQWNAMTHIAVGAVLPQADGSLDTDFYIGPTGGPALADDLVTRAHAAGVRAILMLGGAGAYDGFVGAASDANRATFVANLVRWARDEHHFDGLDLDWEPLPSSDFASFRALAEDLRDAWTGVILTVPIGYLNVNMDTVDPFYAEIASLFDQLNVMSYVMTGAYPGWQSWHSSALYGETPTTPTSIDSTVQRYLDAGVPAAKLGIGIGFFGACYTPPVTGPKQDLRGGTVAASDNDMSYHNIMTQYYAEAARIWDDEAKSPYLTFATATGPRGCGFISYDDAQSIGERAAYVDSRGLGGAIVWTINQGYLPDAPAGSRDPLMDALRTTFLHR